MQIYEIFQFRRPVAEQFPVLPAPAAGAMIRVPAAAVGGVPQPLPASQMPGGMATSMRQTQTGAPPSQMPNAAYGRISSNVPQMQRSGSRAVVPVGQPAAQTSQAVVPAGQPAPQNTNVPAVVQQPRPRGYPPPPKPGPRNQRTYGPDDVIDVDAREVGGQQARPAGPQVGQPNVSQPRVSSMSPEEIQAALDAIQQSQQRTIPSAQGASAQQTPPPPPPSAAAPAGAATASQAAPVKAAQAPVAGTASDVKYQPVAKSIVNRMAQAMGGGPIYKNPFEKPEVQSQAELEKYKQELLKAQQKSKKPAAPPPPPPAQKQLSAPAEQPKLPAPAKATTTTPQPTPTTPPRPAPAQPQLPAPRAGVPGRAVVPQARPPQAPAPRALPAAGQPKLPPPTGGSQPMPKPPPPPVQENLSLEARLQRTLAAMRKTK